jgi:hypothetical protein
MTFTTPVPIGPRDGQVTSPDLAARPLSGTTTADARRIKVLEHEVKELKRELDPRLPW